VVKGGDHHPRMVADLAHAVDGLAMTGGLLLCLTAPPPQLYQAARNLNAVPRPSGREHLPAVQILTISEMLNGRRPEARTG